MEKGIINDYGSQNQRMKPDITPIGGNCLTSAYSNFIKKNNMQYNKMVNNILHENNDTVTRW